MPEKTPSTIKESETKKDHFPSKEQALDSSQLISSPVDRVIHLQRTIGNQAVQRLLRSGGIQAKLLIRQPGDVYEQEADRVADRVMRAPNPQTPPETTCPSGASGCEKEGTSQAKPLVGQVTPLVQGQAVTEAGSDEEPGGRKAGEESVQGTQDAFGNRSILHTPGVRLDDLRGEGRPLPDAVRSCFESRFGLDFSRVRIHTDSRAAGIAHGINAQAFTHGRNIYFGPGHYQPNTEAGRTLLAHELTHTIQQAGTRYGPLSSASPALPVVQRQELRHEDAPASKSPVQTKMKPLVKGKLLGVWKETLTSARFKGGDEIEKPGKTAGQFEEGFDGFQEALVYAGAVIASREADGGVIIKQGDRFYAFTIVSDAWVNEFSRENVEEGFDQVLISESEVEGIQAFVTTDGYAVPWTMSRSPSPSIPVHIVERRQRGGYWHPTKDPEAEGFEPALKDIKEGRAGNITEKGYVPLFKGLLKAKAFAQLEENKKRLEEEEKKYFSSEQAGTLLDHLRQIIAKDKELAHYQDVIRKSMVKAESARARAGESMGFIVGPVPQLQAQMEYSDKMRVLNPLFEEIKTARIALRTEYPALAALGEADIPEQIPDKELLEKIHFGFVAIREAIEDVFTRVHEEDIPLTKLGPIVEQTKKEMGLSEKKADPLSKTVLDWLETQDTKEFIYTLGGTLSSIALGIGAFFFSGGTALLLGIGGAAIGLGTAAYEFKISEGVYRAAQTEVAGGKLVQDPEAARFNYIMGWLNLVLAGLDVGLSVKAGTALVKSGRITKGLVNAPGAEVLAELKPEQIVKLDRALQLRRAGKAGEAEKILSKLKAELGDDVFSRAENLFQSGGKAKPPEVSPLEIKPPRAPAAETQRYHGATADESGVVFHEPKPAPTVERVQRIGPVQKTSPPVEEISESSRGRSREPFPDVERDVPPEEAKIIEGPLSELKGPRSLSQSVSSFDSIETARQAGVPDLLIGDGTVMTRADFPEMLPDKPFTLGRPAPDQLAPVSTFEKGFPTAGRTVSRSEIQNIDVLEDYDILIKSGADPSSIRINQRMVLEDITVGTNRPDLHAELNGRRIHIEYDRAPGTRAIAHALRILSNDPDAIVILKIIDFD